MQNTQHVHICGNNNNLPLDGNCEERNVQIHEHFLRDITMWHNIYNNEDRNSTMVRNLSAGMHPSASERAYASLKFRSRFDELNIVVKLNISQSTSRAFYSWRETSFWPCTLKPVSATTFPQNRKWTNPSDRRRRSSEWWGVNYDLAQNEDPRYRDPDHVKCHAHPPGAHGIFEAKHVFRLIIRWLASFHYTHWSAAWCAGKFTHGHFLQCEAGTGPGNKYTFHIICRSECK